MTGVIDLSTVAKPSEIRAYVRPELKRLLKAVAGLKNTGKDWTISDCVVEAIEDWLKKPENQELIQRHNLDVEEEQDIGQDTGRKGK
jgi:hypothetical protein